MSLIALVSLASAAELQRAPIQEALDAERIDVGEALWLGYLAHFEPERLDPAWRSGELPWHCATEFVARLKDGWELLTPAQREHVTDTLEPFKDQLIDEIPIAEPPPPPGASDTCWGAYGDERVLGEHFSVEWDAGLISEEQALDFLDYLERGWEVEVEELGWEEPAGAGDYLIMAYVSRGGAGAYTTVSRCGGDYLPYIVAGDQSFDAGTWWQDMAVHELKHAIQFSYGYATEFWWWEASATYIQEYVNPENNWWSQYISGYTKSPHIALNAYSQSDYDVFYHMYGMAIWAFYLDEHLGGHQLVQDTWDLAAGRNGFYDLGPEETMEELGYDFREVFAGFLANNTVMDFEDGRYFGQVERHESHKGLPVQGSSSSKTEPEVLGANFIRFRPGDVDPDKPDLLVAFEGDEGGDWLAQLVAVADEAVLEVVELPLEVPEEGREAGQVRLEGYADYDEVWLIVARMDGDSGGYVYAMEDRAAPVEADEDAGGVAEALSDCGCASTRGPGAGLAVLALFGLVSWRR